MLVGYFFRKIGGRQYFDDLLIEQDINDNTNQLFINIKKQWNETCESYKMVSVWRINKNFTI